MTFDLQGKRKVDNVYKKANADTLDNGCGWMSIKGCKSLANIPNNIEDQKRPVWTNDHNTNMFSRACSVINVVIVY